LFSKIKRLLCACIAISLLFCASVAEESVSDFSVEGLQTPEEICTAAMEVYSWFALAPLDVDPSQSDSTGLRYRVFDERLRTPEQLEGVVSEYFSDEITQMLMGSGVYAEEGGYLYTVPEQARPVDETIVSTEYYLAEETETSRVYQAAVFYGDESGEITSLEEYTMLMEKINGKWVFTSFWFFW